MQDRYVGDVGDFAKYALLRRLAGRRSESPVRVGVVWCLFPDETHNNDGRHISYQDKPEFKGLDDPLLEVLRKLIAAGNRSIAAINASGLFPTSTVFCDAAVSTERNLRTSRDERLRNRDRWSRACFAATQKCELVFFDPDNGLEARSVPKHHPNAGKYIYWDELAPFWQRGQTLLVYHHLNRTMPGSRQVRVLQDAIQTRFHRAAAMPLVFRRGSSRVYWLIYHQSNLGAEIHRRACDFLSGRWASHFRPLDWPNSIQLATRSAL